MVRENICKQSEKAIAFRPGFTVWICLNAIGKINRKLEAVLVPMVLCLELDTYNLPTACSLANIE